MAEKILYYLGAGASANALPLACDVTRNGEIVIPGLSTSLKKAKPRFLRINESIQEASGKGFLTNSYKQFAELSNNGFRYGNIDTYAKYLHLKGDFQNLKLLKSNLALYFGMMQLWNPMEGSRATDRRYLQWLISILDERTFPRNIKVLSWNYDFQLELAADNFEQERLTSSNGILHHEMPFITYHPSLGPLTFDDGEIQLIHLNGIAGLFEMEAGMGHLYTSEHRNSGPQKLIEVAQKYDLSEGIHFAWEGGSYHSDLLKKIKTMITDTTIMVVIGYSFPFFNREVDKAIFNDLKAIGTLRKIYFQDPVLNGQQLRAQFGLDETIEIEHVSRVDNFHIPFEY